MIPLPFLCLILCIIAYGIGTLSAQTFFSYASRFSFLRRMSQGIKSIYPFMETTDLFFAILFEFFSGWLIAMLATHFLTHPLFILVVCIAGIIGQVIPLLPSRYDNAFPLFAGTLAVLFGWFFALLMIAMWIFIRRESKLTFFTHVAVAALVPVLAVITQQTLASTLYTLVVTLIICLSRRKQIYNMIAGKDNELKERVIGIS